MKTLTAVRDLCSSEVQDEFYQNIDEVNGDYGHFKQHAITWVPLRVASDGLLMNIGKV
jgi:hypothetical protein